MPHEHYYSRKPASKPQYGLIQVHLRGGFFEFLTSSGVFSKKRVDLGTRLLVESMILPDAGNVLDLGCGYGAVGVVAAVLCPNVCVYMVDVNERAVRLARENAIKNHADNVKFRSGYLYEPVNAVYFDAILSNPPMSAGLNVVLPIIQQAPLHLNTDGSLQLVVRSKIGGKRLYGVMEETFGNAQVVAIESGFRVISSKKA